MKFVLLHEAKNDEGIRAFFMDVWELYVKVCTYLPVHCAISGGRVSPYLHDQCVRRDKAVCARLPRTADWDDQY